MSRRKKECLSRISLRTYYIIEEVKLMPFGQLPNKAVLTPRGCNSQPNARSKVFMVLVAACLIAAVVFQQSLIGTFREAVIQSPCTAVSSPPEPSLKTTLALVRFNKGVIRHRVSYILSRNGLTAICPTLQKLYILPRSVAAPTTA